MGNRHDTVLALALMRADPRDIRPALLLYVIEQDDSHLPALFQYGCRFLTVRFARAGLEVPEDAVQVAVVDALSILRTRKPPYTLKERAKELHMRADDYRILRKVAVALFERRYCEASVRFQQAFAA